MTRKILSITTGHTQPKEPQKIIPKVCSTCRFYAAEHSECHRRTPYFNQTTSKSFWPPVTEDQWCGEYKRTPVTEA